MKFLWNGTTSFVVLASVVFCLGPVGVEAVKPLNRVQRLMEDKPAADGSVTAASATPTDDPLVDSWATDSVLKMAKRMQKGDMGGILLDMAMDGPMDEIFNNPEVSYKYLQAFPMFKVLTGVKEIAALSPEEYTKEHSLSVLNAFKGFVQKSTEAMKNVADPVKYAEMMNKYTDILDAPAVTPQGGRALTEGEQHFRNLVESMEAQSSAEAVNDVHDHIAADLWNGTLDLSELKGKEPEALKQLRDLALSQEPELFKLMHQGDPLIEKVMSDPSILFTVGEALGKKES